MSAVAPDEHLIRFENVSKFYGDVLGVNRVHLGIPPGITSLVGPNGSGKTTLMNLMTGLLRPTRGTLDVLGMDPRRPEFFFRRVGYCTQFDSFPRGLSGKRFIEGYLRVHGHDAALARKLAADAIERVGMTEAATRRIDGYSKGMRQRIKLAQSLAHRPGVLILDEPLNGLDPMARAEIIDLFESLARDGLHIIISSHILHEVDMISDQVIILNQGYVVAEGDIRGVRTELQTHPIQILVRCDRAAEVAGRLFGLEHVVEVKMHEDRHGLLVSTRDADDFYRTFNRIVLDTGIAVDSVVPADEDVHAVYRYLVGYEGEGS